MLFRSDMARVEEIVASDFEVLDVSDTVAGSDDPSTFGYMSQHFEARLPAALTGARYEGLSHHRFEIQVRTILMDAWANVSHYLAYKGEESIPTELRRDFNALSGLFYVADTHFELFFDQTKVVREEAGERLVGETSDLPLNLDTLAEFLLRRFPDRIHAAREGVGELASQLLGFKIRTIAELEDILAQTEEAFAEAEVADPPMGEDGKKYWDVGVVRISLGLLDPAYRERFRGA